MLKRMIGVLLAVSMLLTSLTVFAVDIQYSADADGITITSWDKNAEYVIEVPSMIDGKPVTAIADEAFKDCISVYEISLPSTVRSISGSAFNGCVSLKSVDLNENTFFVSENGAIYNSDKTELIRLFDISCQSFTMPDTVTKIADHAFYGMHNLENIVFTDNNITQIGSYAFYDCTKLEYFSLDSVESVGEYAFYNCSSFSGSVRLTSLKNIPNGMFMNCKNIKNAVLSSDTSSIGAYAFAGCNGLTAVLIPQGAAVKTDAFIGTGVTLYCSSNALKYAKASGIPYVETVYTGENKVTSAAVDDPVLNITLADAITPNIKLTPSDCQVPYTYLVSSDPEIVKIENGELLAVSVGTADITATTLDGAYTVSFKVNVSDNDAPLQSDHPYRPDCTESYSYTVSGSPSKIAVTFSAQTYVESGRDHIIISDKNGERIGSFTAGELANKTLILNGDTVNVSIKADSDVEYYGFCIVKAESADDHTFVQSVVLPQTELTMSYGESKNISAVISPSDAISDITYYSTDEGVVTVDENGNVYAINGGSAFIVAFDAYTNKSAECKVTVIKNVYDGIHYTVNGSYVTLTHYEGEASDIVIPSEINGLTVNTIADGAFMYSPTLKTVTIPSEIEVIAKNAFAGCVGIESFIVDAKNKNYSSVNGMLCDKDAKTLIFYPCGISGNAVIPDGIESIGEYAFYMCVNTTSVSIPDTVNEIHNDAFALCEALNEFICQGGKYTSELGVMYTDGGKTLERVPCSFKGDFTLKSGVEHISFGAFISCTKIESLTLSQTVKSFDKGAFSHLTGLRSFFVSDENASFSSKDGALFDKEGKTLLAFAASINGKYSIPDTVTSIGAYAFYSSSLDGVFFTPNVVSIGEYAFYLSDNLSIIVLPCSIDRIGDYAFDNCSNLKIFAPGNISVIGRSSKAQMFCGDNTVDTALKSGYLVKYINYSSNNTGVAFSYERIPSFAFNAVRIYGGYLALARSALDNESISLYRIGFGQYQTSEEFICDVYCEKGVTSVYRIDGSDITKVSFEAFDGGVRLSTVGGLYAFEYGVNKQSCDILTVRSYPDKMQYTYGEALNTEGLLLNYKEFSGIATLVDDGFSCTAALDKNGENEVTVQYKDCNLQFNVSVTSEDLSGSLVLTGEGRLGQTLTLVLDGITPAGLPYGISWFRDGERIRGQHSQTYTVTSDDSGKTITAVITAENGFEGSVTSNGIKVSYARITSDTYVINDSDVMSKVSEKTTLSTVLDTLNVKNDVKAFDADKELAPDDYVTTGTQLRLYSGSEVIHTVHIVVTGDVNCDGKISLVDFVMMKAYMLGELEFAS
ncbi:MAG: leucine-rich repeat protein [Clostridia bacterium]|nr:leucine-rich repeat protein [Clostridia bacterium]